MRAYEGVNPTKVDDHVTRRMFKSIDDYLRQLNQALTHSIQSGQTPLANVEPTDPTATGIYFLLAGRVGNQIGYGGTLPSGTLTLGSTSSSTKGKIYLGSSSAYDEANIWLGINTTSPLSVLHVLGTSAGGTTALVPSSDYNNGFNVNTVDPLTGLAGWTCYTGLDGAETSVDVAGIAGAYTAVNATATPDTLFIGNSTSSGGSNPQTFGLSATAPTGKGTWTITYIARWRTPIPSAGKLLRFRLILSNGYYYESSTISLDSYTTSWATYTTTIDTSGAGTSGGHANSIAVTGPNTTSYFMITYISAGYESGSDIVRLANSVGTVGVRVDPTLLTGFGTGTTALTRTVTVTPSAVGVVPFGVVTASPTVNMAEWLDGATERAAITKDGYLSSRRLLLNGLTSGTLTMIPGAVTVSHSLTWPSAQAVAASSALLNTSGTLTWDAVSGLFALGSPTQGDVIVGNSGIPSEWTRLGIAASTNKVLRSDGSDPNWAKVVLTTDVSGILPVANGGTNISSYAIGDLLYASGATTLLKLAVGSATQVLIGGTIPAWSTASTLTTRMVSEWRANGPYIIGTEVDGQLRIPTGFTITSVRLYRKTAGTGGSTTVDLNINGSTMFTTQANRPTITAASGNNQASSGTLPNNVTVSSGDVLSMDIDAVETGTPLDCVLIIEGS